MKFPLHSATTAPEGSQATLAAIENSYGFIPNLAAALAESPATLQALGGLLATFDGDALTLTPVERQVAMLAASTANSCGYCMAAHGLVATKTGLARDEVTRIQSGEVAKDAKLEALRKFTTGVVKSRGTVSGESIDDFLAAGFTRGQVFEVVLAVAIKTLTNYANHISDVPLNEQFADFAPAAA